MRMERRTLYTLGGLAAAIALCAVVFGRAPKAAASSRVPSDPAEVLETLPGTTDARTRRVASLRRALAANPRDLRAAVILARLDIQLARERSDPRYLGHAQAALAAWWNAPSPPIDVLVLRATIEQSLHDFEAALADLDRALAVEPDHVQALLTRAVVLGVRGRYEEALATCARLEGKTTPLVIAVCETQVASVTGHARSAMERLEAVMAASSERLSPDEEAWARSSLGEYAQRAGELDSAEKHFRRALEIDPEDGYVRAALADLLLDRDRAAEVVTLLAGREANDTLLLRLALAEKRTNSPKAQADIDALGARFDASRLRGDAVHRREEARFELALRGDARRALDLARANWDVQKEPWDARIYLEAARAAKSKDAAAPILAWLDRTRLEDPFLAKVAAELR
ncbi:MAG TPA: tetratricopeptide repeat protein [Labilithrix sp.]|jgi:tetratricopeptide (TPR) repeat protein